MNRNDQNNANKELRSGKKLSQRILPKCVVVLISVAYGTSNRMHYVLKGEDTEWAENICEKW